LKSLEIENGNLRAAMGRALDPQGGDAETAARLGWALHSFWWYHGPHSEGLQRMEAVLLRSDLSLASRAKALVVAGSMALSHGDHERCERYCEEALELSQQVGDKLRGAWARMGLGLVAMNRTDYEGAASRLREALRSFREEGEDYIVAFVTTFLGMLALTRGEEGKAIPLFEEGLAVARRSGDRGAAFTALYNLAQVALSHGDHDNAATLFVEGVTLSEQVGDRANLAYCLEGLATVAGACGKAERSARLIGAAEGLHEAVGAPVYVYYEPHRSLYKRTMATVRSALSEEGFEEARAAGREMSFEQAVKYALEAHDAPPN
jgi:non-specific serine/threonine protein kinase